MSTIETQNFKDLATSKSIDAAYVTDGTAKAWAHIDQTSTGHPAADSFNLSSTVDVGNGQTTVNFTNDFSNASYAASLVTDGGITAPTTRITNFAVGSLLLVCYNASNSATDCDNTCFSSNGDLA